jgi:Na+-driven multidrug efflux pump
VRLHRYRCGDPACRWEGNFRSHAHGRHDAKTPAWVWVVVVVAAIVVAIFLVWYAGKGGGGGAAPTSRNYSTVVD